jgi:hypothetical protein
MLAAGHDFMMIFYFPLYSFSRTLNFFRPDLSSAVINLMTCLPASETGYPAYLV